LHINSTSILDIDAKLGVNIFDTQAPAVSNHAHEAGANVANLVVVVQELYVLFYGDGRVWVPIDPCSLLRQMLHSSRSLLRIWSGEVVVIDDSASRPSGGRFTASEK
jgi:hypothetical protein